MLPKTLTRAFEPNALGLTLGHNFCYMCLVYLGFVILLCDVWFRQFFDMSLRCSFSLLHLPSRFTASFATQVPGCRVTSVRPNDKTNCKPQAVE